MSSDNDSDSDGSPIHVHIPDPPRVTLAKIFMSIPNPANPQKPIIKEWDGKKPKYPLFVYAYIENGTYSSYVTLSYNQKKQRRLSLDRDPRHDENYTRLMHTGPFSNYFQSYIYNPRAHDPDRYPNSPQLETMLRNLMNGDLSFVNRRDVRDKHRIYMFDTGTTPGIVYDRHFGVTKPNFTYWYKLNNLSGQDQITQGPPDDETIRDIPEDEFELNYKIFQSFNPDNADMFLFDRESRSRMKFLKGKRQLTTHRAGGKKRNKTRRKYQKIKSRRRSP
jgi:hypothetical protein